MASMMPKILNSFGIIPIKRILNIEEIKGAPAFVKGDTTIALP